MVKNTSKEKIFTASFFLLMLMSLFMNLNNGLLQQLVPLYISDMGYSTQTIGIVTMFYVYGAMVCRPFIGRAVDAVGRKKLLILAAIGAALCSMGYILSLPLVVFAIVRVLQGVFNAALQTGKNAVVGDVVPKARMTEGNNYLNIVATLFGGYTPTIALVLVTNFKYGTSFTIATALMGAFGLCAFLIKEVKKEAEDIGKQPKAVRNETEAEKKKGFRISNYIVPEVMAPAILSCMLIFAVVGYGTYNTMILNNRNVENLALALSFVPYVNIIALFVNAKLSKVIGDSDIVISGCVLMVAGMLFLFVGGADFLLVAVGLVLYNYGYVSTYNTVAAMVLKRSKKYNRGASAATWMIMMDVGQGLGVLLWGYIGTAIGESYIYLGLAIVFVACFIYSAFVLRPDVKKWEAEYKQAKAAGIDFDN